MKRKVQLLLQINLYQNGEKYSMIILLLMIIDRLHHSSIIKINGRSYRIKDKLVDDKDTNND